MADGPSVGTAYLRVAGDFSQINSQLVGFASADRLSKLGKAAGAAFAGGLAVGGAVKGLYEIGQAFDDVSDKFRTQTGATGKELGRLNKVFKNVISGVPASFEDAGDAVGSLNQRLGLTGKPLARMSKQMLELSRITETDVKTNIEAVSKAFRDWEVRTKDQSKTLDAFFRLSQKSGVPVDELASSVQRFGSPLRQLGFTLDEAAAMFANFERSGVNTQTMVPGLKLAISNLTRPTEELGASMQKLGINVGKPDVALRQVFDLMSEKGIPTAEKTGLAMDVFGKRAGSDMAEAIKQGRFEVDDLIRVMEKGRDTIRKAGRDTWDFGEQWTLLKNNVFVALEPVAKRVFGAIGDEAARLRKILTDKDLSADEKFSAVLGEIGRVVKEYGPEIAEAGGKLGITLIKGIANAFWESPILGKLFIGAGALRLFGGPGVFGKLGAAIAGKIGAGVGSSTVAGKVTGGLASPGSNPANALWVRVAPGGGGLPGGGVPTGGGKTGGGWRPPTWITTPLKGFAIAAAPILVAETIRSIRGDWLEKPIQDWTEGMKEGVEAMRDLNKGAAGRIRAGISGTDATLKDLGRITDGILSVSTATQQMGRGLKITRSDFKFASQGADLFGDSLIEGIDSVQRWERAVKRNNDDVGKSLSGVGRAFKGLAGDTDKNLGRSRDDVGRFEKAVNATQGKVGGDLRDMGKDVGNFAQKTDKHTDQADKSFDKTTSSSGKMAKGVGRNVEALVNGVGEGLGVLKDNLNKSLAAFKVKSVSYSIKKAGNVVGDVVGAQHGAIVPGTGSGDKVPALLEPGEVVLNRKAVAAMGGAERANSINRKIPRFAKGGKVSGSMAAMIGLVNKYEQASYPYLWGGGHGGFPNGSSPVDCSGFVSDVLHAGGLLSGAPMVSGALMSWGKPASGNEPLVVYANPGHTVMSLNGRVAGTSGSNPGGGAGWIEGGNGASLAPGAKRTMDVAGAAAAIAEKIARIILKGPDGPLKDMGQAALDKARNAANKYIASKMPSGTPGGGNVGDTIAKTMTGTATWYGPLTSQLGAPVSGSGGLLSGNENAFAELGRGTSVGTALGSLPMGTWIKATILGHTANLEKRDVGQGGASTDLVDVWEDSLVNFPGLREAGRAKIKVEPTHKQTGGIIQRLAKGGIVELLGATIGAIRHMNDKRTTKAVERWGEAVKGYGVPAKLVERMVALRHDADKFGEYASNAATLSDDGIFGRFLGATEAEWTQKQLSALFKLRNRLIAAKKLLDRQIRQQVKVLKEAESRLKQTNRAIGDGEDEREDLEERLEKAKKAKNKDLEEHLQARLDSLDERQEVREAIAAKLKSPIISSLKKLGGRLKGGSKEFSSRSLVEEALTSVQGIDGPMRKLTKLPAIGALGGEIFEAQVTLRNLDAEAHPTDTGLDIAGLRDVIEAARYGVFDRYAGTFGSGGRLGPGQWGIAGETGRPEIVHGPATVLSPQATQGALAGNIEVHNDFDFDGMDLIVTTTVNGELAKQQRLEHRRSRQAVR